MPGHLHLISLGVPLLLTEAGEHVRFRTRKHFALLIRLAVEAGRKLSRDYLMDLLWPDVAAPRARHSLAQALTVLKEKVGREHILVQRTSVALAPDAVHADVTRLDATDTTIRGQFLDGFDVPGAVQFEHWKDEWRAKLMPRIRDSLVRQMDAARRIGDFDTVEKHAQILLELDPLSEDGVRGVMEARAWVGDRSNALKAYGRFEARLAEDLGAKPSADLERIANLLREGRGAVARPSSVGQVSERRERRFEPETLIGREREFARLYDAWLKVRRREPQLVVLLGDPGVGKTTLTNAFVSTCQMEGASIARAQAYDAERELPFAVLAELIKQLTLQRAIGGADPEALSELTRIAPEIFTFFPGVPKPAEWAAEVVPLRLADSFLKAVEAAAEESPLALVVDDIHAADNATVAILHIVARKLPRARLLLILTARSTDLRTTAAASALASDSSIEALQTLDLEPLSDEAAERLVGARVAKGEARIADVPVQRILQAGNGNPLALELLTKEWLAHGSNSLLRDLEALNTQPTANIGIPRAIGAVFERQIRRLDEPERAALDLAAVLGRRLGDIALYRIVDLSTAAAAKALSRLKDEGFLREVHGGLEFRNELLRAQAYYSLAGPARQHLHLQVALVLTPGGDENGRASRLEVAWHFLRGREPRRAVTSAVEGARAAIRVGAPLEAEEVLTVILRQHLGEPTMRETRLLLAKALVAQSKAARAEQVLGLIAQSGNLSPEDNAEATRMEATVQYLLNQEPGPRYCEAADRALLAARNTGNVDLVAKALFECARSGVNAGDEVRVAKARDETNLAMSQEAQELSPTLLYTKAYCDFFFYDLSAATTELETAIRLLRERRDPVQLSLAYTGLGSCKHGLCEFEEAHESFLKALALSQKIGDDTRTAMIASNICACKLHEGQYASAIKFGELAVRHGTAALSRRLVNTHLNLAMALLMAGCREDASRAVDEALRINRAEGSWVATMELLLAQASLALLRGEKTLALELIRSAEDLAAGKERAVPNWGLFERLSVYRTVHVAGPAAAESIVTEGREKYRCRYPFAYLGMIACAAWLDWLNFGRYTEETERELKLFGKLRATGLRDILTREGFLQRHP